MNTDIEIIIALPSKFYSLGNISMFNLLKNSGYFTTYNEIEESDIAKALAIHTEYIEDWINWSQNKRSDGWFLERKDNSIYEVSYYYKGDIQESTVYTNLLAACAAFIKHEIEDIRTSK